MFIADVGVSRMRKANYSNGVEDPKRSTDLVCRDKETASYLYSLLDVELNWTRQACMTPLRVMTIASLVTVSASYTVGNIK